MIRPDPYRLEVDSGQDALGEIEQLLASAWSAHPHIPELIRTQIAIATGEIGAYILEHATAGHLLRVAMEVRVLANEVWVEFTDNGGPLHVDLDAVSLPDDMAERGRGLPLAKAVLDRLIYERDALNHWTLVSKRFEPVI